MDNQATKDRLLPYLPEHRCGCCGRSEKEGAELRKVLQGWKSYGLPEVMCSDCFSEWYDGTADPEKIKAKVLERASKCPE